jgi:hypothetical protein
MDFAYYFSLVHVVEEDKVAEHGDEGEEAQPRHDVDHRVLQVKLACTQQLGWRSRRSFKWYQSTDSFSFKLWSLRTAPKICPVPTL